MTIPSDNALKRAVEAAPFIDTTPPPSSNTALNSRQIIQVASDEVVHPQQQVVARISLALTGLPAVLLNLTASYVCPQTIDTTVLTLKLLTKQQQGESTSAEEDILAMFKEQIKKVNLSMWSF